MNSGCATGRSPWSGQVGSPPCLRVPFCRIKYWSRWSPSSAPVLTSVVDQGSGPRLRDVSESSCLPVSALDSVRLSQVCRTVANWSTVPQKIRSLPPGRAYFPLSENWGVGKAEEQIYNAPAGKGGRWYV